jgi:predicted RNA-binding protein with TRAM domain
MERQVPERVTTARVQPSQRTGDIADAERAAVADTGKGLARVRRHPTEQAGLATTRRHGNYRETVVSEDVIDGFVVIFAEALKHEEVRIPAGQ